MADSGNRNLLDSDDHYPPESNNYNDHDFETVGYGDPILEQDEEVTSTSLNTGEEKAEEDLYAPGGLSEADPIEHDDFDPDSYLGKNYDVHPSEPEDFSGLGLVLPPSVAPTATNASVYSRATPDPIPPPSEPYPYDYSTPEPRAAPAADAKEEPKSEGPEKSGEACCRGTWLRNIDPRVLDLIYWRDVRKTGVVFGSMLLVLLSLACFSLLSVVAYLSLAVLTVTLSFRVYKNVMMAVQKSGEGHPFKTMLEMDVELSEDKVQHVVRNVLKHVNCTVKEVRRLFLIEDLIDSIKFGLLLWVLTYVGSWFNGMTLIILAVVGVFTLPKIYETYKVQIDNYIGLAKTHLNNILAQIQTKLPFLKRKPKTQ